MRGRKPIPTAQRRLSGNPGKRRLNDEEPLPPAVTVAFDDPPPELGGLRTGSDEWRRLAPMLRRSRQITEADRTALLALCIEWDRYLEAKTNAYPRVVKAPSGYPMPNPWLPIQRGALSSCIKLWAELGLTPSSRARVVRDGELEGGDAFAEFDTPLPLPADEPRTH